MLNVFKSFLHGFNIKSSTCPNAATPAKPLFATGHEHESTAAHLGTIHDNPNDGFGNVRLDEGSSHAGTVSPERKIPPAF